jgi:2-polyprenyl-3-methyl-5-hydroxy-6-metoxy-1,4-benzoquinol methylase
MINRDSVEKHAMDNFSENEKKQRLYFDNLAHTRRQERNNSAGIKDWYIEEDVYRHIQGLKKAQTVIDIGCGDGEANGFTEFFASKGMHVTFVDISSVSVNSLASRLADLGYENYRPIAGKFKDLTEVIKGETFDIIFFGDTLHHLTEEETADLFRDLLPFMHADSKIVAFEPNGYWPFWRIMPYFNKEFIWEVEKNIVHCTKSGFKRKFKNTGVKLENYIYYRIVPLLLMKNNFIFKKINDFLVKIPILRMLSSYSIVIIAAEK